MDKFFKAHEKLHQKASEFRIEERNYKIRAKLNNLREKRNKSYWNQF